MLSLKYRARLLDIKSQEDENAAKVRGVLIDFPGHRCGEVGMVGGQGYCLLRKGIKAAEAWRGEGKTRVPTLLLLPGFHRLSTYSEKERDENQQMTS